MRKSLVLLVTMLIATAMFAGDAQTSTLMLRKAGNCSGVVTAVDHTTRSTLASCGFGCNEVSVEIPVGTLVRVSTQAYGQCSGRIDPARSSLVAGRPSRLPFGGTLRMDASGIVVTAQFRMSSNIAIPNAYAR